MRDFVKCSFCTSKMIKSPKSFFERFWTFCMLYTCIQIKNRQNITKTFLQNVSKIMQMCRFYKKNIRKKKKL